MPGVELDLNNKHMMEGMIEQSKDFNFCVIRPPTLTWDPESKLDIIC